MKLHLQYFNHQPPRSFSELVESQLELLRTELHIDEARVRVEQRPDASPAFRVAAHLVTPGPDIQAEAVDHTLRAALHKLVAALSKHIQGRNAKRARRARSNHQRPSVRRSVATARAA